MFRVVCVSECGEGRSRRQRRQRIQINKINRCSLRVHPAYFCARKLGLVCVPMKGRFINYVDRCLRAYPHHHPNFTFDNSIVLGSPFTWPILALSRPCFIPLCSCACTLALCRILECSSESCVADTSSLVDTGDLAISDTGCADTHLQAQLYCTVFYKVMEL